jgi:hypothetical protein
MMRCNYKSAAAAAVSVTVAAGAAAGSAELDSKQQQHRHRQKPAELAPVASAVVPAGAASQQQQQQVSGLLSQPYVLLFLWRCLFLGLGMGVMSNYEFLWLKQLGAPETLMGFAIAVSRTLPCSMSRQQQCMPWRKSPAVSHSVGSCWRVASSFLQASVVMQDSAGRHSTHQQDTKTPHPCTMLTAWPVCDVLQVSITTEVPAFTLQGAVLQRVSPEALLNLVLSATALRLTLYGLLPLAGTPWAVLPVELLHGVTFGLGWGAATASCTRLAPAHLSATMQVSLLGS